MHVGGLSHLRGAFELRPAPHGDAETAEATEQAASPRSTSKNSAAAAGRHPTSHCALRARCPDAAHRGAVSRSCSGCRVPRRVRHGLHGGRSGPLGASEELLLIRQELPGRQQVIRQRRKIAGISIERFVELAKSLACSAGVSFCRRPVVEEPPEGDHQTGMTMRSRWELVGERDQGSPGHGPDGGRPRPRAPGPRSSNGARWYRLWPQPLKEQGERWCCWSP